MKKYIVLRGHVDEHFDGTPCLLLEFNDNLRQSILDRTADAEKMTEKHGTNFYSLEFFDYSGDWFDLYSLDEENEEVEELFDKIYDDAPIELAEDSPMLAHIQAACKDTCYDGGARMRTECDSMVVMTDRTHFKAYPKHTDFRMESVSISLSFVQGDDGGQDGK